MYYSFGATKTYVFILYQHVATEYNTFKNFSGRIPHGFGYNGATPICFITHKIIAVSYIDVLDNVLVNFSKRFCKKPWNAVT